MMKGWEHHTQLTIAMGSSVAHFGARRIRSFGYELEPNRRAAVGTPGANGGLIKRFVLLGLEPHQPEAFRAATDLR